MSRATLAVVSDLHCGSTVGLHPNFPTPLDDGGAYVPSQAQEWLWERWTAYWHRVAELTGDGPLHVILNGDLVDGDHHGTAQIVSPHPNTQMDIVKVCLGPMLALKPASVAVIRGTEVHVGKSGSAEESIARWLVGQGVTVPREPGTGNASHWHFYGEYAGLRVDAAHHGRVGRRPWTKASGTLTLAAEIVMEYAMAGRLPPQLAVRSHFHQWVDTGDAFPTRLIQTPAFQLKTAFVHRVAAESLADVGGAVVSIEDGIGTMTRLLYRPALAPHWVAPHA